MIVPFSFRHCVLRQARALSLGGGPHHANRVGSGVRDNRTGTVVGGWRLAVGGWRLVVGD
ncbi:hypothetical protein IWQ48_003074 [Labrenzia sp. EL_13]|nr:hypothetical protein [Labrenzia sp. EL_13]